jgi:uncharacterized protein YgbK (DUF1537 family)
MAAPIVFVGDDFTGASDTLATYARRGLRTRLLTRPVAQEDDLDALGVATDLRSLSPEKAGAVVDRLWPVIAAADPRVLHFKVCSTFDSAPGVGSIGAVAARLSALFAPDVTAVIGGQPSLGRYCAFGTLFARGPDGGVHRIDRHPVMARHPVTPMHEADLLRHLAAQGLPPLARITVPELTDPARVADRLCAGPALVDVMREDDQALIRSALEMAGGRQLLIGASSVAEILGGAPGATEHAAPAPPEGALLVFAGSRSSVTAAQVAAAHGFKRVCLAPETLEDPRAAQHLAARIAGPRPLLVHLDPDADYKRNPDRLADDCARLVAEIADRVPLRGLGLAGGDTSSRIIARLGFDALDYLGDMGQGACICLGRHADPARDAMRVMLKGGQMGARDLFDRFADRVPA